MEDKKQDVNPLEELAKTADSYRAFFANLANELSKVLVDIKASDEEENTWEMKCPYEYGDKHYCIQSSGDVFLDSWHDIEADNSFFSQGNIFPTKQAAELEAKRRNLLTRFRAFRDECNRDLSVQDEKWEIHYKDKKLKSLWFPNSINGFPTFGYFKNREDAERAIELFGDEIKELFVDCEG
jgi:hypothetical protein